MILRCLRSRITPWCLLVGMIAWTTFDNQKRIMTEMKYYDGVAQFVAAAGNIALTLTMTTGSFASQEPEEPKRKSVVVQRSEDYSNNQNDMNGDKIPFVGSNEASQMNIVIPNDPLRRSPQEGEIAENGRFVEILEGGERRESPIFFSESPHFPLYPQIERLGVLIDGGRYYFPLPWLYRLVDVLAVLNYNLIHFRLTDDQCFNVLLDSHPELAYPCPALNPERRVYTAEELRKWNAYARKKGVMIMPEVNVPGHSAAWAGAGLVAHCPRFACRKAYGLPLNIHHPQFRTVITEVINEVVDIFDNPDYLHLGGDEFTMAMECIQEAGVANDLMTYYQEFEYMLGSIINETGYPEDQVVRWEMTGYDRTPGLMNLQRAGGFEHMWHRLPAEREKSSLMNRPKCFTSTRLYFDTNGDQTALEIFKKTRDAMFHADGRLVTAVIAGTFELSTDFWYDRNTLGRLIAIAMATTNTTHFDSNNIITDWEKLCYDAGLGPALCGTQGSGVIRSHMYRRVWNDRKRVWDSDICNHLTKKQPIPPFFVVVDPNTNVSLV